MSNSVFDALDRLNNGARRPSQYKYEQLYEDGKAPRQQHYYDPNDYMDAQYAQDAYDCDYSQANGYAAEPMQTDSFDERVMRMPDYSSRQGQAALGRARLSLPPTQSQARECDDQHSQQPVYTPQQRGVIPDPGQYAYQPSQAPNEGPSSGPAPVSSPAFRASQRKEAPRPRRHSKEHAIYTEREQMHSTSHEEFRSPYRGSNSNVDLPVRTKQPPTVKGIELVSTHELPDRFRSIFPFPLFNAMQSKCFKYVYNSNDNFVLSSPTGSGKTAIFELAICRLIQGWSNDSFKVIYMAPTKSLCSERKRDWQAKFSLLNVRCEELTGDSDSAAVKAVQTADIIVTTPEKWDSMTRKWKDHEKLVRLVKLFLIDEVHILNKNRGAALEAVVSRMKSVGSDVRFVALSATVPNSQDIATWLGRDPDNQNVPAIRERFGEEFRPVLLQKYVCGYQSTANDFSFDRFLNQRLPSVISKYSQRKPIMIFCFTRKSCVETAKALAEWWTKEGPSNRYWEGPKKMLIVRDRDLQDTVNAGVAVHHAGLDTNDRATVEREYLTGEINVICCTSTLAVGVNLPCHMVIIKNTVSYESMGTKEYSDLDIMQMLGRAGRPQFDISAVAVIMTRMQRVNYYDKMVSGQEVLESCLHLNLIEHLNAEISLGTITDLRTAKKWLSGTFLCVRLSDNPDHYKIEGDAAGRNLDERLERICNRGISLLQDHDLVTAEEKLKCTEFGDAMARYYVDFPTMTVLLSLPPNAKISEILSALAQAHEFRELRLRAAEKQVYKELNKLPYIRFPIKVDLALPAHKVSLIIQSVLGNADFPSGDYKHRNQYNTDTALIFQHVHRLSRCIIDCQLYMEDSISARNALMLARSLGARVWDDSPLHLKQLEAIGPVAVRKLVAAGIRSIEDLEDAEPHRIESILSKNPPFGRNMLARLKAFPKLRVSLQMVGQPIFRYEECPMVKVKAEIGFLNEDPPLLFQKKPVYICMLADTSDGKKVYFARISAKRLGNGQSVLFSAQVSDSTQSINCFVMCDDIAGTQKQANLRPDVPPSAFLPPKKKPHDTATATQRQSSAGVPNTSRPRVPRLQAQRPVSQGSDEYGDGGLDDHDFVGAMDNAGADGFKDIDDLEVGQSTSGKGFGATKGTSEKDIAARSASYDELWEPKKLENGKWACSHRCKDKTACKHLCCKEGTDNKPKPPKAKAPAKQKEQNAQSSPDKRQMKLQLSVTKRQNSGRHGRSSVEEVDLTQSKQFNTDLVLRLHDKVQKKSVHIPTIGSREPDLWYAKGTQPKLSFLQSESEDLAGAGNGMSTGYGDDWMGDFSDFDDDFPDNGVGANDMTDTSMQRDPQQKEQTNDDQNFLDDDEDMLDAAFVGFEDSQRLKQAYKDSEDFAMDDGEHDTPISQSDAHQLADISSDSMLLTSGHPLPAIQQHERNSLFVVDSSSPVSARAGTDENIVTQAIAPKRALEDTDTDTPDQSSYFATKKFRTAIQSSNMSSRDVPSENSVAFARGNESPAALMGNSAAGERKKGDKAGVDGNGGQGMDSPKTAELKAFLLNEFGEGFELVDGPL